ncbi:SDR family NAD(P)-dependent oxidoreductase [uncultured Parasphingopyxis sp.]|uniref:SDR family NAD(P)-dependent oxidoreductase n=1 Tax=uncultured Parasphingopyxis sp. TaxID=1547918 RepID=UPI0026150017|nr:SDR family NAD(P)-dependent oxidoreductase [uncultured Parasphingopyxis sp.]
MNRFEGKSIIVTGAGSGIGRASAKRFAAEGGKVLCADKAASVHETVEAITADGGTAIGIEMDAGSESDVKTLVEKAVAEFGGLDIAYANAGITGGLQGGLFDSDAESWAEVLRVNLIGPFLMIKYAAPEIEKRGGGAIICTASVAGIRSGAGPSSYSASKAGVINLVQTAAQQMTGSGVRVNAVCPGLIETGMTQRVFDYAREAGKMDKVGQLNPMKRAGQPEELAAVVTFLASDDASYLNGQAIAVDGGLSSSHPVTRQLPKQAAV